MKIRQYTILLIATFAINAMATTPRWLRDVKISPDGSTIAFTYRGDIWTVASSGGEARRLTSTDNVYEDHPVWSPDSKLISFSSDRNGNFDVYVVDAQGGTPRQLTFDSATELPEMFSPDGQYVYFSAALQNQPQSVMFPSARMTQLYQVPVDGGRPVQIAGIPVQMPSYSAADHNIIYYQDLKGFEDEWRKHHTSSVTRDIWQWNRQTDSFKNITNRAGEDRNPVISADGTTLYYLSEAPGASMNVFSLNTADPANKKALTAFTGHPVRFLSGSDNGVLCFAYDGDIYTMLPGSNPQKVNIDVTVDATPEIETIDIRTLDDAAISPDGKSVAFISRGDVFVTSVDYSSVKQITNTPQAEMQVSWSPDGKKLVYTSERDGLWNIYTAETVREKEPNFENATLINETALFTVDGKTERSHPSYSPDGKKLAYIEDRRKLMVKDMATGHVNTVLDGSTHFSRGGGFDYSWSPDSEWIVAEAILHKHDPYSDILLVNVDDGRRIPLTETGYFDASPRFVLDGEAVIYLTDRYGMRNHASWGSQEDVMIVFLNEEAYDRFNLNEEDYALKKELEKSNKGDDAKPKVDDVKKIKVEARNMDKRTKRLTQASGSISDAFITSDGETLYYLVNYSKGYDLWKRNLRKGKTEEAKKLDAERSHFLADKSGSNLFVASSKSIKKLDTKGDKLTDVKFATKKKLDRDAERNYMFDYVKRQEREMFYDTAMHGVDWENLTEHYRQFLPHIANNYDFAELLSEMLGELNVSHTGGRYSAPPSRDHATASLGLLYDMSYAGEGMKILEIIENGAMDKSWLQVEPGDVLLSINGNAIGAGESLSALLENLSGKKTLVTYRKPSGAVVEEVVVPESKAAENKLLYDRWVKNRAADVERWSDGRLGYVHVQSMGDGSFRDIYADILGKYNEKEGIVIDIRWNGGGRLHEDIEILFSGEKYFTQVVRGDEACDMPSRRWNKPSIMVMSEACYSNAHGTPWVYKHRGLGKLVGAPVPGTMTSVNWMRMQDPSMVFGIPVTGYRLPDGSYLENSQLEPDIYVLNTPYDIMRGEDMQLKAAVDALLETL